MNELLTSSILVFGMMGIAFAMTQDPPKDTCQQFQGVLQVDEGGIYLDRPHDPLVLTFKSVHGHVFASQHHRQRVICWGYDGWVLGDHCLTVVQIKSEGE